jgi:CubicO group peptidase (beta-lactamase class C family)
MFAAGELAMTAHDLALWDESLIGRTILKPASYEAMFTEVKLKDGGGTHYGLGVEVLERQVGGKTEKVIEHSGEVSGFVSDNYVVPGAGVAIAVLTNQDAVGAASQIARQAVPVLLGAGLAEDHAGAEAQAVAIYRDLQKGKIDRGLLAPNLNDYFTDEALGDFASSLGPLGEPESFKQVGEQLRGGMTFRVFSVVYAKQKLTVTTYTYPDGKLEQYLVGPAE